MSKHIVAVGDLVFNDCCGDNTCCLYGLLEVLKIDSSGHNWVKCSLQTLNGGKYHGEVQINEFLYPEKIIIVYSNNDA